MPPNDKFAKQVPKPIIKAIIAPIKSLMPNFLFLEDEIIMISPAISTKGLTMASIAPKLSNASDRKNIVLIN